MFHKCTLAVHLISTLREKTIKALQCILHRRKQGVFSGSKTDQYLISRPVWTRLSCYEGFALSLIGSFKQSQRDPRQTTGLHDGVCHRTSFVATKFSSSFINIQYQIMAVIGYMKEQCCCSLSPGEKHVRTEHKLSDCAGSWTSFFPPVVYRFP